MGTLTFVPVADGWMLGRAIPTHGLFSRALVVGSSVEVPAPNGPSSTATPSLAGSEAAPVAPSEAHGGRTVVSKPSAADPGWGFGSPIGRFAVTRSGVLLGGSDDGSARVRLVVPGTLVAFAALFGAAAVLGQRRVERRRRTVE
jgi:hypothetical protein